MTYYTGTINSAAAFKSAIENALVSEGWTLTSGVLTLDDMAVRFVASTNKLDAFMGTGRSGSSIVNEGPFGVGFAMRSASGTIPTVYPCVYHIYAYDTEIYVGLNWNTDYYQWMAFGKFSDLPSGEGHFISGPTASWRSENTAMAAPVSTISASAIATTDQSSSTAASNNQIRPPMIQQSNAMLRVAMGGAAKWYASRPTRTTFPDQYHAGTEVCAMLNFLAPGASFYTSILGVIMGGIEVINTSTVKLCGRLKYARITRNDYLLPGSQMTFGAETWNVWPMDRRVVAAAKNGFLAFAFLEE
jgi:hypothetical protein